MSRSEELLSDLLRAWPADLPTLRASIDPADQVAYARDLWPRHHMEVRAGRVAEDRPALIVWPESTHDVQAVVRWAAERRVPLVPFGAGSGVCGGVSPTSEVVVVDLKRMARWRHLDEAAPTLDVEAGALGLPLEEALVRRGFTLGHFPSSILCSTVGGWVAGRSAGQCSGYYGKIEDMVVALECVTGEGRIVTLERRAHGPDLTPLMIGSEGILGIVTSATLRLHPAPTARAFGAFTFPGTEPGWQGMRAMFQAGLRPAVSRLYDPFDAMLARMGGVKSKKEKTGQPAAPGLGSKALRTVLRRPTALNELIELAGGRALGGAMLVVIFEGQGDTPAIDMERARAILGRVGGKFEGEDPARRWIAHRYAVSYRQAPVYASGAWVDTMEVAATWKNLGPLYDGVRRALGRHAFVMAHLSHAYPDGCCIYFSFAGSAEPRATDEPGTWDAASLKAYESAWNDALAAAEAAGGTIAHHHGVGRSKAPRLGKELGHGVEIVRALKRAFDPRGILNPGNLLPPAVIPIPVPPVPLIPSLPLSPGPFPHPSPNPSPSPDPTASITLDRESLLADVPASLPVSHLEAWLAERGLTLGITDAPPSPIGEWIASGAPGSRDPWLDPADHLLAGYTSHFRDGGHVVVRPAPRRSVGPDLFGLILGGEARFATLSRVSIRVHTMGTVLPETAPFKPDRDPPMSDGEAALLERIADALD